MKYECEVCKKEVDRKTTVRCRSCFLNRGSKKYLCCDCLCEVKKGAKRCKDCSNKNKSKIMSGLNGPSYLNGKTLVESFCKKCNKKLNKHAFYYGTIYCRSCVQKVKYENGKRPPNYIDGRTNVKSFCLDCKRKLANKSKYEGSIRCKSCSIRLKFLEGKLSKNIGAKGVDNPSWKGGISSLTNLIRNCDQYKKWRKFCFNKDNYTCRKCKEKSNRLNADHIKLFSKILQEFLLKYSQFSPIEDKETLLKLSFTYEPFWDTNNGQTLCLKCHKEKTKYYKQENIEI